jgi:hypothetical protein
MKLRVVLGLAMVLCGVARTSTPDELNRKLSDLTGRIAQLESERDDAELLYGVASFVGKHGDAAGYRIKAVFLDLDAKKLKREQRRLMKNKVKTQPVSGLTEQRSLK